MGGLISDAIEALPLDQSKAPTTKPRRSHFATVGQISGLESRGLPLGAVSACRRSGFCEACRSAEKGSARLPGSGRVKV